MEKLNPNGIGGFNDLKKRIQDNPGTCPFCQATAVDDIEPHMPNEGAQWTDYRCTCCGFKWSEKHSFSDCQILSQTTYRITVKGRWGGEVPEPFLNAHSCADIDFAVGVIADYINNPNCNIEDLSCVSFELAEE